MISHRHRCIFVHIPKTGGTSIESVIWPIRTEADLHGGYISASHHRNKYQSGGLQHLCAKYIRQEVGAKIFEDYFKFSIVRNPWDRIVSQYAYTREQPYCQVYFRVPPDVSFPAYLDAISKSDHVHVMPQTAFLYDDNGEPLVDFIGRYEDMPAAFRFISEKIGIEQVELPRLNTSARNVDFRTYYTPETRERVAALYADEIARFGYCFD